MYRDLALFAQFPFVAPRKVVVVDGTATNPKDSPCFPRVARRHWRPERTLPLHRVLKRVLRMLSFFCFYQLFFVEGGFRRWHKQYFTKMLQPPQEGLRKRLLEETRISVKSLLSTCVDNSIDDNSPQLERFCLVLEKILRHGLKGTLRKPKHSLISSLDKSTIFGKKDYWNVLEVLPKFHPAAADSVRNVSDLSQVKTVLGRGRAWIRFALIEKNLEEYLRVRRNQI